MLLAAGLGRCWRRTRLRELGLDWERLRERYQALVMRLSALT